MPSLSDPDVARAALDVYLDPQDRRSGGLAFLFCGADGRLVQPTWVSEVPPEPTAEQRRSAVGWAIGLCEMVGDDRTGPLGLILAIARESGGVCDGDRAWHQTALECCAEAEVPLIGVHIVTMDSVTLLPTATDRAA